MSEILEFPGGNTTHSGRQPRRRTVEPSAVIAGCADHADNLDALLCIGVTHDGKLYASSTHPDFADLLLMMRRFERKMMRQFGRDEFA